MTVRELVKRLERGERWMVDKKAMRASSGNSELLAADVAKDSYEQGWLAAAGLAGRDDLPADVGSPAYVDERKKRIGS